jgi:hypothetical protein
VQRKTKDQVCTRTGFRISFQRYTLACHSVDSVYVNASNEPAEGFIRVLDSGY